MTRLHRDAPAELAPPRFIEIRATLRDDLLRIGLVAIALFSFGAMTVLTLTMFTAFWELLGMSKWRGLAAGLWGSLLLSFVPFGIMVVVFLREFNGRHELTMARLSAEQQMLVTSWLDLDADTHLEDDELARFIKYVAALYRGEPTTAKHAATYYKISAGTWQSWRNAIVSLGLATEVDKRGGPGFELHDSILHKPWDAVEEHIRQNAPLSVRKATGPGVLITQEPQPKLPRRPAPVTTLPGDMYDASNTDGD